MQIQVLKKRVAVTILGSMTLTVLVLIMFPGWSYAQVDCGSGVIAPTDSEREGYVIHPWYAEEKDIDKALVTELTRTDYGADLLDVRNTETTGAAADTDKQRRSSSGSLETDIILGMTDFIIDRAKAETVNWYMDDIQKNLCDGRYSPYFYNTCVMRSQSKETLPYLPGLVQAFRKDLEWMPANLLCTKFQTERGYYLTTLVRGLMDGYPPENMLAGLAQNGKIVSQCSTTFLSQAGNTCDLYTAGILSKAYIKFVDTKQVSDALTVLDGGLTNKLGVSKQLIEEKKPYLLEMVGLMRDMQTQVKTIRRATKEGGQRAVISNAAQRLSRDLMEVIDNPLVPASAGRSDRSRELVRPAINAINSISAGQYADAMLDINVIINRYYDERLSQLSTKYRDRLDLLREDVIAIVASSPVATFSAADFKSNKMTARCDEIYARYFGAEKKHCASLADFDELLGKKNLPERALGERKGFSRKVEGLLIIQQYLEAEEKKPLVDKLKLKSQEGVIQVLINRMILEETFPDIPKRDYCFENMLEAFAILFNPDIARKSGLDTGAFKYLTADDRIEGIKKTLHVAEPGFIDSLFGSEQCNKMNSSLTGIVSDAYSDRNLDIASSLDSFQKYLPTVASLATAKSPEEVKNVLNETVSSVGSWRLKQKKDYTGSFGAMLGLDAGYEFLGKSLKNGWSTGLFAPVGFDFTMKNHCPGGACGLFVSIFDLGTVASMRLTEKDEFTSKEGDLHLSEVASPGLYAHVNLKNTPVVVGVGWSYVPLLRTGMVNNEKVDTGGSRVLFFMAIDLPMYFF